MTVENATIPLIDPLVSSLSVILSQIKIWVGGLFGLYFIYFIVRLYMLHKNHKNMVKIRRELSKINSRLDAMGLPMAVETKHGLQNAIKERFAKHKNRQDKTSNKKK